MHRALICVRHGKTVNHGITNRCIQRRIDSVIGVIWIDWIDWNWIDWISVPFRCFLLESVKNFLSL